MRTSSHFEIRVEPEVEKCRIIKADSSADCGKLYLSWYKKKRGSGHIIIRAFHSEPNLILQVKDDGCGMSRETCEKMLSYEIEQENISGSGIGVKNVNERIQLRFGKEYGLHYDSEEGKGTTVTYTLPYCTEEMENAETKK